MQKEETLPKLRNRLSLKTHKRPVFQDLGGVGVHRSGVIEYKL